MNKPYPKRGIKPYYLTKKNENPDRKEVVKQILVIKQILYSNEYDS